MGKMEVKIPRLFLTKVAVEGDLHSSYVLGSDLGTDIILPWATYCFPQHLRENMGKYLSKTTYLKMSHHFFLTHFVNAK
jgi:hypothetical protein